MVDRKSGNPLGAAALLLRGFSSVKPLLPAESMHLRVLVACRLVASGVMGAYSRQFVSAFALSSCCQICFRLLPFFVYGGIFFVLDSKHLINCSNFHRLKHSLLYFFFVPIIFKCIFSHLKIYRFAFGTFRQRFECLRLNVVRVVKKRLEMRPTLMTPSKRFHFLR